MGSATGVHDKIRSWEETWIEMKNDTGFDNVVISIPSYNFSICNCLDLPILPVTAHIPSLWRVLGRCADRPFEVFPQSPSSSGFVITLRVTPGILRRAHRDSAIALRSHARESTPDECLLAQP